VVPTFAVVVIAVAAAAAVAVVVVVKVTIGNSTHSCRKTDDAFTRAAQTKESIERLYDHGDIY